MSTAHQLSTPGDRPAAEAVPDPTTIVIDYTNYRGERAFRRVLPNRLWFGTADWHREPQWILDAWDVEKGVIRSFAMRDIHSWEPDT